MAPLRPWHRLSVRLAVLFASVTLVAVAVVGLLVYEWQRREVEEAVTAWPASTRADGRRGSWWAAIPRAAPGRRSPSPPR